jgi:hypothetical protein
LISIEDNTNEEFPPYWSKFQKDSLDMSYNIIQMKDYLSYASLFSSVINILIISFTDIEYSQFQIGLTTENINIISQ